MRNVIDINNERRGANAVDEDRHTQILTHAAELVGMIPGDRRYKEAIIAAMLQIVRMPPPPKLA